MEVGFPCRRKSGLINYLFSKRGEAEGDQFQVLNGKGNADNGNGTQAGKYQVGNGNPDSSEANPENIHYQRKTAGGTGPVFQLFAEGQQRYACQLETLQSEGNANNGEAQQQATQQVFQEKEQPPAENDPKQISDYIHACEGIPSVQEYHE
jgi:hypothetical protein